MSVLEGGIYFDELISLPSHHLALLMLGLIAALLGAIAMGIAGFVAGAWRGAVRCCAVQCPFHVAAPPPTGGLGMRPGAPASV